jgi:hypothetical protein
LRELFALKVSVHASQSTKSIGTHARSPEIGHFDLLCVPDHNVLDVALPVEKYAYLPAGLVRKLGHLSREF